MGDNIYDKGTGNDKKYVIGSIRVDGIMPTDDFLEFAEKEKYGLVTDEDVIKINPRGYTAIPNK